MYLKRWLDDHPEARPLHLAYYGKVDPHIADIEFTLPPQRNQFQSADLDIPPLESHWYAISVNLLRGFPHEAWDGKGGKQELPRGAYKYFQEFHPAAMAGYSIFLYYPIERDIAFPKN